MKKEGKAPSSLNPIQQDVKQLHSTYIRLPKPIFSDTNTPLHSSQYIAWNMGLKISCTTTAITSNFFFTRFRWTQNRILPLQQRDKYCFKIQPMLQKTMLNYLQQVSGKEHDTVSHTSEIKLLGYKPNAASSGSFFHFPSEAGGLSHITVLCKSKSPMERSATCQSQTHAQRNSVFQSKFFFLELQFKKTFLDLNLKQTNKQNTSKFLE